MKSMGAWIALAVTLPAHSLSWPGEFYAQGAPSRATALVFDEVTVIDVEGGQRVPGQRVVVIGNRIQAVGRSHVVSLPKDAKIVDARGKYLIPGLWDMHTHLWRYGYATEFFYPLFLAYGVTGVRDAGASLPLDTLQHWRSEILTGLRIGPPRQILSGQAIAGPRNGCERHQLDTLLETCVADSADAVHYVDSLLIAGADMIKPRKVSRKLYYVIAHEARRIGIPFGGHIDAKGISAIEASDSGASVIDHLLGSGGLDTLCWGRAASGPASVKRCRLAAEHLRRNGTWLVPTLAAYAGAGATSAPRISRHLVVRTRAFWRNGAARNEGGRDLRAPIHVDGYRATPPPNITSNLRGLLHFAQQAGLPIVAGTDVRPWAMHDMLPGMALHAELAMYVAEGLTPLNALQSTTSNPAKLLHAIDSLGTVAPGKLADLVLLDADPLADITNTMAIDAVVANGRYFDRAALDSLLLQVQAKAPKPYHMDGSAGPGPGPGP